MKTYRTSSPMTLHLTASYATDCTLTNLLFNCTSVLSSAPHAPQSSCSSCSSCSSSLTIPHPSVLSSWYKVSTFALLAGADNRADGRKPHPDGPAKPDRNHTLATAPVEWTAMGKHKQVMCEICYRLIRGDNLLKGHMKAHQKKKEAVNIEGPRCPYPFLPGS